MKKLIFLILFIFSTLLYAKPDSTFNYLNDGSFSIQFQLTEDFTISDFQGTIISAKYHLSQKGAIRIGVSLSYSNSDSSYTRAYNPIIENEKFSFEVISQYIYYIINKKHSLYFGSGPNYKAIYKLSSETRRKEPQYDREEINRTHFFNHAIGLNIILGGEYFLTNFLSMMVEYGFKFEYSYKEEENIIRGKAEVKEYRLNPMKVKIGFSLNF